MPVEKILEYVNPDVLSLQFATSDINVIKSCYSFNTIMAKIKDYLPEDKDITKSGKVKFISYSGRFPVYCSGTLALEIEGTPITIGANGDYKPFWYRGDLFSENKGWLFNEDWVHEDLLPYLEDIKVIMKNNLRDRCCGGCL